MSGILIHSGDEVLSDITETRRGDVTAFDEASRKLILRLSSHSAAQNYVAAGAVHPDFSNLFCAGGTARPKVCGHLYEAEFDYKGRLGSKSAEILVQENNDGWDTATERLVSTGSTSSVRALRSLTDTLTGFANMYCMTRDARPIVEGLCAEGLFSYKGFAGSRNYKYIPRGYSEKQAQNPAVYPGQTTPVPLESNQPLVGVTLLWFSTTIPSLDVCGTNVTPSFSPGVPTNVWTSLPNPLHVWPYGWVLETREPDIIPGTTCCFVKDEYIYYHRYKPGGG
jgi:hypothetical protein